MTTIAYDGVTIAGDGLRTWGSERRGTQFKKLRVERNQIFAFTGLVPLHGPAITWYLAGADPQALPPGIDSENEGWTLIVVDEQGLGKLSSSCPYMERFDPPIAFGAGGDYAIGAMLAGASAKRAVEIVCQLCNHTGGEIQVINVADIVSRSEAA